jgi:dehydrogenase/reductase SDR family member 4
VVVSSRQQAGVDAAVARLRGQGVECAGAVCHVGNAEHRERLITTAVEVCGG